VFDTNEICKRGMRGVVTNASTLTFTRGNGTGGGCTDAPILDLAWERVELPTGALVQPVTITHSNNAASGSATLPTSVDLTRTAVFMAGQTHGGQVFGESDYSANDVIGAIQGTATLTATTVTVTRPTTGLGTATFSPFVVQFVP
jgi:hypothetical protein